MTRFSKSFVSTTTAALAALGTIGLNSACQADILLLEDFEDPTVAYTVSDPDDLSDAANRDYYGVIRPDTVALPADIIYNGLQGLGYYGVQDTDGATTPDADNLITLTWTGVSIANYQDLEFSVLLAEDDSADGFEDWDTFAEFRVETQIDGGGFFTDLSIRSEFGISNYAASKAGLIGLTRSAAVELGPMNINVNAVAPGYIRTTRLTDRVPAEILDRARERSVLGRLGDPQDVSSVVLFLCSEAARHITGAVIPIDAGYLL